MPIRKLGPGKYQADIQDKEWGIPRTKHTCSSRKEAKEWIELVYRQAKARLLGHRGGRLFGEALIKYLREESPQKITHANDLSNAAALRWPTLDPDTRRWIRLEEAPLEDVPAVLQKWVYDLRQVSRRAYLDGRLYHKRKKPAGGVAWYEQPDPTEGERPEPRKEVADAELVARLEKTKGRGPFTNATIRQRQLLVSRILNMAWRHWNTQNDPWIGENLAAKIQLAEKPLPRECVLETYDELLALLIAAPVGFDAAILAGAWTGWRRANLLGLEWSRVVFPVYEELAGGERRLVQPGYIWTPRRAVKRKTTTLTYPMVPHLEQLLGLLWETRNGPYVFQRGDGRPFVNFKKLWASVKRRAGVPADFVWHGLRHTWATWMLTNEAHDQHIIQLAGWTSGAMLQTYKHLRTRHLQDAAALSKAPGTGRLQ